MAMHDRILVPRGSRQCPVEATRLIHVRVCSFGDLSIGPLVHWSIRRGHLCMCGANILYTLTRSPMFHACTAPPTSPPPPPERGGTSLAPSPPAAWPSPRGTRRNRGDTPFPTIRTFCLQSTPRGGARRRFAPSGARRWPREESSLCRRRGEATGPISRVVYGSLSIMIRSLTTTYEYTTVQNDV